MLSRLSSAPLAVRWVIGVAVGLLIALLVLRLFAMTPMARAMVEARVEAMTIRGQKIEIEGLKGDVLGRMTLDRLSVRDEQGVWVNASDVEFRWSASSAVFGHLNIKDLAARDLSLQRRPALATAAQPSTGSRSFFKRYQVQRLEVLNLGLADGIAGPAQRYVLGGQVDARGRSGEATLNLVPTGGDGDNVRAEIGWGGTVPVQGEIVISGAPSGLIATLLDVPAGQGVSIDLDASGDADAWQLTANGRVGDEPALLLESGLQDGVRTLQGSVTLTQIGRLEGLRQRLGEAVVFNADLSASNQISATAEADSLALELSGTIEGDLENMIVEDFRLDVSDLDLVRVSGLQDLEMPNLSATGTLALSPDARVFTGELAAPGLRYGNYTLRALKSTGRHELRGAALTLENQMSAQSDSDISGVLNRFMEGPLILSSTAGFDFSRRSVNVTSLSFRNQKLRGQANGTLGVSGPVEMSGTLQTRAFSPINRLDGTWSLQGQSLASARLRVSADTELGILPDTLSEDGRGGVSVDLVASRANGDLILESGRIRNERIEINTKGALRQGALDFDGSLISSSLALDAISSEALDARFTVEGTVSAPRVNVAASADALSLYGQLLNAPHVMARLSFADGVAFDLNANAVYLEADLNSAVQGSYQGGVVQLRELRTGWDALTATGQGRLVLAAPNQSELSLKIEGTAPIVGAVNGGASYVGDVLIADLSVGDFAYGSTSMQAADVSLSGTWPRFEGALNYDGEVMLLRQETSLSGQHGLKVDLGNRNLIIDGQTRIGQQDIVVSSPVMLAFRSQMHASGALAAFDGGVSFDIYPQGGQPSQLNLDNVSMSKIGPLLLRPSLRGNLNAAAELSIVETGLVGTLRGDVTDLARGAPDAPAADLSFEADIDANQLTAQVRARDADQALDLIGTLSTPLTVGDTIFSLRRASGAPVPISLEGGGPIAPLWALVAPPDLRLEGDILVDIDNGAGDSFHFQGPLTFNNGVFEDGFTGLHLTALKVDAALEPSGISVRQASASGIRGGQVEGSGDYDFDGAGTVALRLNRLNALNRSDIDAVLSGQATIDRRNRRTHIGGDLVMDEARVNLSSLPGAGYTTIDVAFADPSGEAQTEAPAREAISLDLGVSAPRRIFVTGPALDSEWGVDARVTGSPGRPNIVGRATLIRGEADLLSRRFRLTDGNIRFIGDPTDSEISISAARASGDISAWIDVSGNVLDPSITLRADPPLPDDEIIARILFGRSPSELSPLQAAQLAGAAAQLAGGEAFNLMNQLEASVGLDRLDFGFDESGAAILSTGKYLADDIYLELQSGGTGAPGVALEWTPLDNVEVDAEVDPELGPKVSIKWKRDFDDRPDDAEPESE